MLTVFRVPVLNVPTNDLLFTKVCDDALMHTSNSDAEGINVCFKV
jgi:hypothetical protein